MQSLKDNSKFFSCILLLALATGNAKAEQLFTTHTDNLFQLSVSPEFGVTDNFLYQDNDKQETSYLTLNTEAKLQLQSERQLAAFDASFSHVKYHSFSQDDHSNYQLAPSYQFKLATNQALFIQAEMQASYQERGTGLSLGQAQQLNVGDEQQKRSVSGGFLYGQQDSVAKLTLTIATEDHRYQTRRSITRVLDHQTQAIRSSFDYLLSDYSYLASELIYQDVSFAHNPLQDKRRLTALLGIKWQTTAATRLAVLIGYQQVDFTQSTFKNDSAMKWQLDWQWHPVESSKLLLQSKRDFQEANRLTNSYRLIDAHYLKVQHSFSEYWQLALAINFNQEQLVYSDTRTAEDYLSFNAELNYQSRDWLSFYLRYTTSNLDAKQSVLDYQRSGVSLGFSVTI